MSRPASELIVLIEPERIGIPSITYNGELLALKDPIPRIFKADWGSSDFAMDYRPVMGGEERREYIYNGLVAGALRDGNSHDEAIAYANENIDDYAPVPPEMEAS